jgi:ERI1 exoribonuclease 3
MLAIVDFEVTCWDKKDMVAEPIGEIIEFPCVILDRKTGANMGEFHEYVQPILNPILSNLCYRLTGISQVKVDYAKTLPQVVKRFQKFLKPYEKKGEVLIVTCGNFDFGECYPDNYDLHDSINYLPTEWCNIKDIFKDVVNTKARGMVHMLGELGLPLLGHHHSGIDDARNIACIARELIRVGGVFNVTSRLNI